jgi:hypothetical protein
LVVIGAWLGGQLGGMADPRTYPSLESLLGEDKPKKKPEPGEASANAKAWGVWLQVQNKKAGCAQDR